MKLPIIESERIKREITKEDFAKMLQVSRRTVTNWQNGRTEVPLSKLLILANMWKCSVDYLLGLSKDPQIRKKAG